MQFDPCLSHLSPSVYTSVYEPAEDTYLLCDALYAQLSFLQHHLCHHPIIRCIEVGSGAGMVIAYLSALMQKTHKGRGFYWATDINTEAAKATLSTMNKNAVMGDVITCDLLSPLSNRMEKAVDVFVCNPPYVPSDVNELSGSGISRSWAGGERGRAIIDQLVMLLPSLLSMYGVAYCVLLQVNDPDDVNMRMRDQGFVSDLIISRQAGDEQLQVFRYMRQEPEKHTRSDAT